MANLSKFKRNLSAARERGEWVQVGIAYDDLEILTRGFTHEYTDMRNQAMRNLAVRKYRGDAMLITTDESNGITVDCLAAKSLLGVRNLNDDSGQPVELPAFIEMLRDIDYSDLLDAACIACANVGKSRAADAEADVKN